jgi:signal transduction histidine kinase
MSKVFRLVDEVTSGDNSDEPVESATARRVLQQAVMSKYHVNVTKLHSSYDAFVVREMSSLHLGILLAIATVLYVIVGCYYVQDRNAQAVIGAATVSLLPAWVVLGTTFKFGIPMKWMISLGNATLLLHSMSCAAGLICITIRAMDLGTQTVTAGQLFASIITIISLGVLPCILRCHTPIICALSWAVVEGAMILSLFLSAHTTDLTICMPGLMLLVGFQMYSFERSSLSAYNHLMGLEDAIRLSLDADNQQKVFAMQSAEMRHLIGNVAHDLKTPMQAFSLELNGLAIILATYNKQIEISGVTVDPKATDVFIKDSMQGVKTLKDTVHFMLMTINRAIDFSKASAGIKLSPSNSTCDIVEAIEWTQHLVADTQSRVPIIFRPISDLICSQVITDNQWLIENLLCLVANAVKFTEEGSVTISCSLDMSKQKKPLLRFEVEDTGIGILPEMRAALFKPFSQAQRCAGGTGLGLYSLSKRMDALQGDCGLGDRHDGGQGCRFWFRIPYVPDIDAAENAVKSHRQTDEMKSSVRSGMFSRLSAGKPKHSSISPIGSASANPVMSKFRALSPRGSNLRALSPVNPLASTVQPTARTDHSCERGRISIWDNDLPLARDDVSARSGSTINDMFMTEITDVEMKAHESLKQPVSQVTVLLVEDSIVIQKSTAKALSRRNVLVDVANNGSIGLRMMMKNKYDVVLMDLQMPVSNRECFGTQLKLNV